MPSFADFQLMAIPTQDAKRVGRQLHPDYDKWDDIDDYTELPGPISLSILLADHLTKLHVLSRDDTYSALAALRKPLARYADKICPTIAKMAVQGLEKFSNEITSLEVLGGRYVRFGMADIFDLHEQKSVAPGGFNPAGYMVWSHSVIPAGLYLALCMQQVQSLQEPVT